MMRGLVNRMGRMCSQAAEQRCTHCEMLANGSRSGVIRWNSWGTDKQRVASNKDPCERQRCNVARVVVA